MTFDPDYVQSYPAIRQSTDWTCSACSWAWLACSIGTYVTEWQAVDKIGYPEHINSTLGLTDATGRWLAEAYISEYAWPAHYLGALDIESALSLARDGPLLIGGRAWCHWSAVRGTDDSGLILANPAPTWFGVGDYLDRAEWARLGAWSGVWLAG